VGDLYAPPCTCRTNQQMSYKISFNAQTWNTWICYLFCYPVLRRWYACGWYLKKSVYGHMFLLLLEILENYRLTFSRHWHNSFPPSVKFWYVSCVPFVWTFICSLLNYMWCSFFRYLRNEQPKKCWKNLSSYHPNHPPTWLWIWPVSNVKPIQEKRKHAISSRYISRLAMTKLYANIYENISCSSTYKFVLFKRTS
jgi:hypothetical protein